MNKLKVCLALSLIMSAHCILAKNATDINKSSSCNGTYIIRSTDNSKTWDYVIRAPGSCAEVSHGVTDVCKSDSVPPKGTKMYTPRWDVVDCNQVTFYSFPPKSNNYQSSVNPAPPGKYNVP